MRHRTAGRAGPWEIWLTLSQENPMVFRIFIVAITAIAVLSPAALASLG